MRLMVRRIFEYYGRHDLCWWKFSAMKMYFLREKAFLAEKNTFQKSRNYSRIINFSVYE